MAISLLAGDLVGEHRITIRTMNPGGNYGPTDATIEPRFEESFTPVHIFVNVNLTAENVGRYTFDIFFDDQERPFARLPLSIEAQPPPQAEPPE
jgi:hypothetical protein